ncbi:hypothetical protein FJM67_01940 [Maribrevibacterium harenarium]|uniref:Uncharacterized protein n=1 Tax=Maribrevibacterium harenarium TaxID=2589817 RepID=A0A501X4G1_9GAMM|nr:hypothetical protein [Maribrevibacterium harenarium]TPE55329.1 hypothetical protein FJM67_01940 [Maribrevibacterium harenarium]
MIRMLLVSAAVSAVGAFSTLSYAEEVFDPSSVPCALSAGDFKKMYVGTIGDYEWKKGLAQVSKSTGFYDVHNITPNGSNACQVELQQHQCLTLFLDENWEDKFGTNSGEFSCVNLRTGEAIAAGDLAYQNSVQERMIKMRCPHGSEISDCSNDSNSKRGNDFRAQVLAPNNWEMESVCAGHIREPRYFSGGKVGDRALCAITNQQGEALYKVIIPMEYAHNQPLKKLDGETVSYRPKAVQVDMSDQGAKDALFMPETALESMVEGTPEEVLAITLRCTSRMFTLMEQSGEAEDKIEQVRRITAERISQWGSQRSVVIPGTEGADQAERLYQLAGNHAQRYGNVEGPAGLKADTQSCIPLYQQTGLF